VSGPPRVAKIWVEEATANVSSLTLFDIWTLNIEFGNADLRPVFIAVIDSGVAMACESAMQLLPRPEGVEPGYKYTLNQTPLLWAAENGPESTVQYLLYKGVDITTRNDDGQTALHKAASKGRESMVKLLLENGADIAATDEDGQTPLHKAALNGHERVVLLLLEYGESIEWSNDAAFCGRVQA
jgi:Ankyrin repeats (3 copies)/Ankyrin repeat